jgi:hypothetical protein
MASVKAGSLHAAGVHDSTWALHGRAAELFDALGKAEPASGERERATADREGAAADREQAPLRILRD